MNVAPHTAHSVSDLCNALYTSAEDNNIPVPFFANLIWQESGLQLDPVSSAGALGIAQFMPKVAAEVGLHDPFDPHQALPASARFLRALRDQFGNLGFVAAAYNAGAHRVARLARSPPGAAARDQDLCSARHWPLRRGVAKIAVARFATDICEAAALPPFAGLRRARASANRTGARTGADRARKIAIGKSPAEACANNPCGKEGRAEKTHQGGQTSKARQKAVKVAQLTENTAEKAEKKRPVGHRGTDEPKVGHSARNFHPGKHEAVRPAHSPHEKRKVA